MRSWRYNWGWLGMEGGSVLVGNEYFSTHFINRLTYTKYGTMNNCLLIGQKVGDEKVERKTLACARTTFIGKPYSRETAKEIGREGFGFTVSCKTGNIADLFEQKCSFKKV